IAPQFHQTPVERVSEVGQCHQGAGQSGTLFHGLRVLTLDPYDHQVVAADHRVGGAVAGAETVEGASPEGARRKPGSSGASSSSSSSSVSGRIKVSATCWLASVSARLNTAATPK